MLFLAYPSRDYDEPQAALASYVEVLGGYSDAIIAHVTDNKTGIQRRLTFPPRVAELVAACDECAAYLEKKKRYENWGKNDPPQIDPPKTKLTYEELKAKYPWEPPPEKRWYDNPPRPWDDSLVETDADGKKHIKVSEELKRAMKEREEFDKWMEGKE